MNKQPDQFRFRSKDFIGVADAAEDGKVSTRLFR